MADLGIILVNDREAAELLGISRATLWRHSRSGVLPAPLRIGGATRWRRSELVDVVDRACAKRDRDAA